MSVRKLLDWPNDRVVVLVWDPDDIDAPVDLPAFDLPDDFAARVERVTAEFGAVQDELRDVLWGRP